MIVYFEDLDKHYSLSEENWKFLEGKAIYSENDILALNTRTGIRVLKKVHPLKEKQLFQTLRNMGRDDL